MKNAYIYLIIFLTSFITLAQSPDKFSYQAVIRDGGNVVLNGQTIGMQISILQGSVTGTAVYEETHNSTTNTNGLVTLQIGTGTIVSGDFSTIDWSNGPYFIKTETDPTGGSNYTVSGTSQMLSVPYALYAQKTEKVYLAATALSPSTIPDWTLIKANKISLVNTSGVHSKIKVEVAGLYQITCMANIVTTIFGMVLKKNNETVISTQFPPSTSTVTWKGGTISWTILLEANDEIEISPFGSNGSSLWDQRRLSIQKMN